MAQRNVRFTLDPISVRDQALAVVYSCCGSGCRRPAEAQLERPTYPVDFSLISEGNLMKIVYLHSYYY